MKVAKLILSAFMLLCAADVSAMDSFDEAKRTLPGIMKKMEDPATLYCGCPLVFHKNRYAPDLKACGYKVRKNPKRAARIEAEHIMPAWEFGHQMQCWQEGGRKQCARNDSKFKMAEGDLHNLYPAVGEVNGDRNNFRFSQWNGHGMYGKCNMAVDFKGRRAQPPERARGLIARAYLYMSKTYDIKLSDAQRKLFKIWDESYKPDRNECLRNKLIEKKQGNDNPFVTARCKALNY